jgi:drug/metabolite transporter (DMT)-like permease
MAIFPVAPKCRMSKRGWILFLALGVLWGMPYLLIRIAVAHYDPLMVAGTRTLIGALLLLPVALHRKALGPAFRQWKWLIAFTLVEITFPWVLLGHAEKSLNSSTAGLLIAAVPLIAAVIITRLGHEKLEPRRLFGLCLGFAGVALLVGLDIDLTNFGAVAATMLTAVGYAIGPIIIDRKLSDVPALGVITASLILATLIYAPFAPALWPTHFDANAAGAVVGLGVLCTAARHGDHLHQSRGGHHPGCARAEGAADGRHGGRLSARDPRRDPRHRAREQTGAGPRGS